ncbi:MAG: peptide chain release factor 3 [Bdellovibrionales bacterium GWB1_52_6]|nr:MAG: peptide chain release factor 3 [Bdellovibrionales bacterium GWB1_52_6]OFZ05091.1 MAG: peptide chain release factor 3 [Bdellovibrionales bacterium GWA1_52_35]HCM41233.1 peptide chain release factor 3 [Bdellovibrionales bacterium]
MDTSVNALNKEVERRRTFAIISHPDAGKTTLTEKLLLYGGAIHLAGAVRAKANQRHTTSDWMEIEKQRGISISSSVLQFEYQGVQINLLDTPGHKDFSEDTYRTLTAADAAVMLIDAAKGVEPQTRKLFEVCRMRGIPIFTFMNKLDRPSRDPLDLLDELEKVLGIRSCPITWPIGTGDRFRGVYDRSSSDVLFFQTEGEANVKGRLEPKKVANLQDPVLQQMMAGPRGDLDEARELHEQLQAELELLEYAGDSFDHARVLAGQLTPVFFGSAMNNFGVQRFLERFISIAPAPTPRNTSIGPINPTEPRFSGFIFKIQANMDPAHRDRVAFMRVCTGKFVRNMEVQHTRLEKNVKLSKPLQFFAQERVVVEQAWPGDIVGMLDTTGDLRIGDTLCAGKPSFEYEGVPRFSPEHFASVLILDPMKRKQLKKGLDQLAEEGVVQVYKQRGLGDKDPILGAVGALQFEVLQARLKSEYSVDVKIEKLPYIHARWIEGQGLDADYFERREDSRCLMDRDGLPVVLFKSDWGLRWAEDNYKNLKFLKTAPMLRTSSNS